MSDDWEAIDLANEARHYIQKRSKDFPKVTAQEVTEHFGRRLREGDIDIGSARHQFNARTIDSYFRLLQTLRTKKRRD